MRAYNGLDNLNLKGGLSYKINKKEKANYLLKYVWKVELWLKVFENINLFLFKSYIQCLIKIFSDVFKTFASVSQDSQKFHKN